MIKSENNNTRVLFFFFIFAFVLAEPSVASIKDGEGVVYEGSTATIALADTYKRTLRKATSVTYSWTSENTSYVTVASSTQVLCCYKRYKTYGFMQVVFQVQLLYRRVLQDDGHIL